MPHLRRSLKDIETSADWNQQVDEQRHLQANMLYWFEDAPSFGRFSVGSVYNSRQTTAAVLKYTYKYKL